MAEKLASVEIQEVQKALEMHVRDVQNGGLSLSEITEKWNEINAWIQERGFWNPKIGQWIKTRGLLISKVEPMPSMGIQMNPRNVNKHANNTATTASGTTTTTTTTTTTETKTVATNSDSDDDVPELEPMTKEEDKTAEIREALPWAPAQPGIVWDKWTFDNHLLDKKTDTATTTTTTTTTARVPEKTAFWAEYAQLLREFQQQRQTAGPIIEEIEDEPVTTTTTTTTGQETKADTPPPVVRYGVAMEYDFSKSLAENVKMREEAEEEFKQIRANEGSMNFADLPLARAGLGGWMKYDTAIQELRQDHGLQLPINGWWCSECDTSFIFPTTQCAHEWMPMPNRNQSRPYFRLS